MKSAHIALFTFAIMSLAPSAAAQSESDDLKILQKPLKMEHHIWRSGQMPTRLGRVDGSLCVLTHISGRFKGYGERAGLQIERDPKTLIDYWILHGQTKQDNILIKATCVSHALLLPSFPRQITARLHPPTNHNHCTPKNRQFSDVPRAYFIASIAGAFNGGGEQVRATSKGTTIMGCSGAVEGTMLSYAVGDQMPVYRHFSGVTSLIETATVQASYLQPERKRDIVDQILFINRDRRTNGRLATVEVLARADDSICGLTMVQGALDGLGEYVSVKIEEARDGTKWWTLESFSSAAGSGAWAEARCLSRDQRGFKTPTKFDSIKSVKPKK